METTKASKRTRANVSLDDDSNDGGITPTPGKRVQFGDGKAKATDHESKTSDHQSDSDFDTEWSGDDTRYWDENSKNAPDSPPPGVATNSTDLRVGVTLRTQPSDGHCIMQELHAMLHEYCPAESQATESDNKGNVPEITPTQEMSFVTQEKSRQEESGV